MRTRKRITIQFETHGAAFDDCERGEIARIIRNVARSFADDSMPEHDVKLFDINGNTVGHVVVGRIPECGPLAQCEQCGAELDDVNQQFCNMNCRELYENV